MMPEYGHALLCLALGVALLLSVYPLWGVARGDARMMASAGVFAWLLFICVAGAFFVLVHAFVVNDFTVAYVASTRATISAGTGRLNTATARVQPLISSTHSS
ncbi:hypothetical protein MJN36_23425, partial [Salmonella enterica subsp. enterica serovar Montevideo]|nr:hypothetical protein [Salmonella enterica subsp. enterica serovar Montevideo]